MKPFPHIYLTLPLFGLVLALCGGFFHEGEVFRCDELAERGLMWQNAKLPEDFMVGT